MANLLFLLSPLTPLAKPERSPGAGGRGASSREVHVFQTPLPCAGAVLGAWQWRAPFTRAVRLSVPAALPPLSLPPASWQPSVGRGSPGAASPGSDSRAPVCLGPCARRLGQNPTSLGLPFGSLQGWGWASSSTRGARSAAMAWPHLPPVRAKLVSPHALFCLVGILNWD